MIFIIITALIVVGTYLYMIMPRMGKKKGMNEFRGRYYAHRGFHDNKTEAPENSVKAFANAVANGYGIELDVQLTKDEVVVVFHDDELMRVCGCEGKVSDYTFDEIQKLRLFESNEGIPKFTDVLAIVEGQVPLIVEIKMAGSNTKVCELVNEVLQQYKGVYCVESFNPFAVRWYKKNEKEVVRGQLASALNLECKKRDFGLFVVEYLLSNFLTRPDFIAYNHLFMNNLSCRISRTVFGCFAVTWTIKSQEELERAKKHFDIFIFEGFIPKEL